MGLSPAFRSREGSQFARRTGFHPALPPFPRRRRTDRTFATRAELDTRFTRCHPRSFDGDTTSQNRTATPHGELLYAERRRSSPPFEDGRSESGDAPIHSPNGESRTRPDGVAPRSRAVGRADRPTRSSSMPPSASKVPRRRLLRPSDSNSTGRFRPESTPHIFRPGRTSCSAGSTNRETAKRGEERESGVRSDADSESPPRHKPNRAI